MEGRDRFDVTLTVGPSPRRAIFFDVENSSRAQHVACVLEHLAVDHVDGRTDFFAVGNWGVVSESRRRLETDLRTRLRGLVVAAEKALARARETRTVGAAAVEAKFGWIAALQLRVEQLGRGDGE